MDQRLKTEFLYEYTDEESLRNPVKRLLEIPRVVEEIIWNLNDGEANTDKDLVQLSCL